MCRKNVFIEPLPKKDTGETQTQIDGRELWSAPLRWALVARHIADFIRLVQAVTSLYVYLTNILAIATKNCCCYFYSVCSQHVSAPTGHPHVKYNNIIYIFLKCYRYHNGSVVLQLFTHWCKYFTWGWPVGAETSREQTEKNNNKNLGCDCRYIWEIYV
jgi:hypothetical protein